MFENILEKNRTFIREQKTFRPYLESLEEIVRTLNHKKILSITGIKKSGKTGLIYSVLKKTQSFDDCFYFNNRLDLSGSIKNEHDLITLFDMYVRLYNIPKIIILQDCEAIEGIKSFISKLIATKKYKILLVGNNIRAEWITEFELHPLTSRSTKAEEHIYGWLPDVRIIPDTYYKQSLLSSLRQDILLQDIFIPYNIKNIFLYYNVLGYISSNDGFYSNREMHRQLSLHHVDISLLTLIDYLSSAINTKFLKKSYLYDMKKDWIIQSRACYYFWDTGLRKTFHEDIHILEKNSLFLLLESQNYKVYGWKNGRFEFDFYAKKDSQKSIALHIERSNDKSEIRKTARKLAKIWNNSRKYLIVKNKDSLGMRKFVEEWVHILEFAEFLTIVES